MSPTPTPFPHFYADLQMYNNGPAAPDPEVFLRQFCSWEVASKANKWQGRNITRWQNHEYDDIHKAAQVELDPVKRAAMLIKLNDPRRQQLRGDPRRRPPRCRGGEQQARLRAHRLGQQHLGSRELVQGGVITPLSDRAVA